jgi:hypothetical protein
VEDNSLLVGYIEAAAGGRRSRLRCNLGSLT